MSRARILVPLFARVALAAGFLSAVADRFGVWGAPEAEGVAWGSFGRFLDSVAGLNPWLPEALVPAAGVLVTASELGLAVALAVGWRMRVTGAASGCLLLAFGIGMTVGTGVKSALDASVFAAAAAGFLLALTSGGGPTRDESPGARAG